MCLTNNEVFDQFWSNNIISPTYQFSTAFLLELYENCVPGHYWIRHTPGSISPGAFISSLFYKYENIKIAVICQFFYKDIICDVMNTYDTREILFDFNNKLFFIDVVDSKFVKFFLHHTSNTSETFDLVPD